MDCMIKHIKIIERMDQLIRLQATGSPEKFAQQLRISRTKLYRMIKLMRAFNAPIEYDTAIQSYVYTEVVGFIFGFYSRR
ncbi:hypothetical protein [Aquimarina megaterium]|uniref:hypothetical protein n=1 Tax=Aquimarina megaterium TaxID=1443666 RepID=UPI0009444B3A|nr:hypothetical protein [Aquimarina megaterium]